MAHTYRYRGTDQFGERRRGRITAVDRSAARSRLSRRGIGVTALRRAVVTDVLVGDSVLVRPGMSASTIAWIFRNLASLQGSGLTLVNSCEILADQRPGTRTAHLLIGLQADLESGLDVADAFARREAELGSVVVAMIAAGAPTGDLRPSFASIASMCSTQVRMRRNVRRATGYPLVVVGLAAILALVMIVAIVPRFEQMYLELGADLPSVTTAVVDLSAAVRHQLWIIPLVMVLLMILVVVLRQLPSGRAGWDWLVLKLPRIGPLVHRSISTRSAATLGALLANRVPMLDALELTGYATDNSQVERSYLRVRDAVAMGIPVGAAFAGAAQVPITMQDLAVVGDASGTLPEVLQRYAAEMQFDVERDGESFARSLEPVLIVVVGVVIGVVIVAMYLPIFRLFDALG